MEASVKVCIHKLMKRDGKHKGQKNVEGLINVLFTEIQLRHDLASY